MASTTWSLATFTVLLAVLATACTQQSVASAPSFHCPQGESLVSADMGEQFCASASASSHFQGNVDFTQSNGLFVAKIVGQPEDVKTLSDCVVLTTEILSVSSLQTTPATISGFPVATYAPRTGSPLLGIPAQIVATQRGMYQLSFDYTYRTDHELWGAKDSPNNCAAEVAAFPGGSTYVQ